MRAEEPNLTAMGDKSSLAVTVVKMDGSDHCSIDIP